MSTQDSGLGGIPTSAVLETRFDEAGRHASREAQVAEVPTVPSTPFQRPLPRTIAIANQKGGVGKTTTAVNLGACLAELGYRVLVVDLDPQGNASTGLGINIRDLQASMYDVILNDLPIEDCVEATAVRNLFVRPGGARPGRGRDRAGPGVQPRDAPAPGARCGAGRLRLRADRLPALARACSRSTASPPPAR